MRLLHGRSVKPCYKIEGPSAGNPKQLRLALAAPKSAARQTTCEVDLKSYGNSLTTLEIKSGDNAVVQEPSKVLLLGTNHKSYYSMEQTQTLIQETVPEAVFVEVCSERQENLLKRLAMRCRPPDSDEAMAPALIVATEVQTVGFPEAANGDERPLLIPTVPGDIIAGAEGLGMMSKSLDESCRRLAAVGSDGGREGGMEMQVSVRTAVDEAPLGFTLMGGCYRAIYGCRVTFTSIRGGNSPDDGGSRRLAEGDEEQRGQMSLEEFLEEQEARAEAERSRAASKAPTPLEFRMGVESGQEFLAAVETAFQVGTPRIILGDQSMQVTGQRLSSLRQERRRRGPAGALRSLLLGYGGVSAAVGALQAEAGGSAGFGAGWEGRAEALRVLEHFQHTLGVPLVLSLAVALFAGVVPGFNLAVILKDKRLDKGEKEKVFLRERDSHMAAALLDVAISPSSTDLGGGGIGEQPPYFERLELPGGVSYLAFRPSPSPASSAALLAHGLRGSDEDEQEESSAVGGNKAGGVGGGGTVVAVVGSEHVAGITENWEKLIQG